MTRQRLDHLTPEEKRERREQERARMARWRAANPERAREISRRASARARAAHLSTPEGAEEWRARMQEYKRKSEEKLEMAHPGRKRERDAERLRTKPELWWRSYYLARARRLGFEPVVEDFTRADVVARYGEVCFHCGGPFEHLDHFPVPVAHNGPHTLDNVKPACKSCNQKGCSPSQPAEFRRPTPKQLAHLAEIRAGLGSAKDGLAFVALHPRVRKGDEPILGLPAVRGPLGIGVVRKDQHL